MFLEIGMDLQWRLFNKLPEKNMLDAYKFAYLDLQKNTKDKTIFKQYMMDIYQGSFDCWLYSRNDRQLCIRNL